MEINFSKYHGLGNDFIIIDYQDGLDYNKLALNCCNRHLGIGADGLIVVKKEPLEMLFYNQDGSRGTMCGNGLRCFAKYCFDNNLINQNQIEVHTLAGIKIVTTNDRLNFKVNMGKPSFNTLTLKMNTYLPTFLKQKLFDLEVSAVFTGAVHVVTFTNNLEEIIKTDLGEKISNHEIFKDKANVNFVEVIDENNFKVKTYERGVGWTLACGTGACASFIIGNIENRCHNKINIQFQYGSLLIERNEDDTISMSGPAEKIASGVYLFNDSKKI